MLFQGPARDFTVSGVIGFGEADNLGGARLVGFDLPTAQEVEANREAASTRSTPLPPRRRHPEQLRDRIRAALDDPKLEVLTGQQAGRGHGRQINDTIGRFLGTALLAFASSPCWWARS